SEKEGARLEKAAKGIDKEVLRLDVNPKMPKALRDLSIFRQMRKSHEAYARMSAQALSAQVEIYKLNNGDYPPSSAALAEKQPGGGAALIPKDQVRDPWGREYKIDPTGKHNGGNKADVYSLGHPLEKKVIGNWPQPKEGKEKGKKGAREQPEQK